MSFDLPNLDERTYQQLLAESLRRIPQHTQHWTDYNDSDPGITLLQLLCWLHEALLYQANTIPLDTQQNFLRWVLGLAFSSNQTPYSRAALEQHDVAFQQLQSTLAAIETGEALSAADLQRAVLSFRQQPYLATSLTAVATLARETNRVIAAEQAREPSGPPPLYVQRADVELAGEAMRVYILSNAQPRYRAPSYPNQQQHLSSGNTQRRVLVLDPQSHRAAEHALLTQVRKYLAPRVLAGSACIVSPAQLTLIDLAVVVRCTPNTRLDVTLNVLAVTLFQYLLPQRVVSAQAQVPVAVAPAVPAEALAWNYGVAPELAQLEQLILSVPGVHQLVRVELLYVPTLELDVLAQLGVNTLLAALPAGAPAQIYRGLPRVRCLDVTVTFNSGPSS